MIGEGMEAGIRRIRDGQRILERTAENAINLILNKSEIDEQVVMAWYFGQEVRPLTTWKALMARSQARRSLWEPIQIELTLRRQERAFRATAEMTRPQALALEVVGERIKRRRRQVADTVETARVAYQAALAEQRRVEEQEIPVQAGIFADYFRIMGAPPAPLTIEEEDNLLVTYMTQNPNDDINRAMDFVKRETRKRRKLSALNALPGSVTLRAHREWIEELFESVEDRERFLQALDRDRRE
jgi:hypothetical protein